MTTSLQVLRHLKVINKASWALRLLSSELALGHTFYFYVTPTLQYILT